MKQLRTTRVKQLDPFHMLMQNLQSPALHDVTNGVTMLKDFIRADATLTVMQRLQDVAVDSSIFGPLLGTFNGEMQKGIQEGRADLTLALMDLMKSPDVQATLQLLIYLLNYILTTASTLIDRLAQLREIVAALDQTTDSIRTLDRTVIVPFLGHLGVTGEVLAAPLPTVTTTGLAPPPITQNMNIGGYLIDKEFTPHRG